ncbi:transposase [Myxococcota bacterium]
MKRYIGIDAHKESCTLAVMGPSGRRLREEVIETNGRALRTVLRAIPGDKHICLEESELAEWLHEICHPLAAEVVVTQPLRSMGSKSDSIDAWNRADELRRGVLNRLIFKAPGQYGALREAVRAHLVMQGDLVRAKNRLKGIFRSRGFLHTGTDLYTPLIRSTWIDKMPRTYRKRAGLLGDELDRIVDMADEAETWLLEEAKRTPAVKLISTAPGIGWIRSAEIVATVVSPHRFRSSRPFWSFCGLAVLTAASAQWLKDKTGQWVRAQVPMARGLNRNRNLIR